VATCSHERVARAALAHAELGGLTLGYPVVRVVLAPGDGWPALTQVVRVLRRAHRRRTGLCHLSGPLSVRGKEKQVATSS